MENNYDTRERLIDSENTEIAQQYRYDICENILALLLDADIIVPSEIKDAKFEFGYFYRKLDGEIRTLIKVCVNEKIKYFAVQENSLFAVDIDEKKYNDTIEYVVYAYSNNQLDSIDYMDKICIQVDITKSNKSK